MPPAIEREVTLGSRVAWQEGEVRLSGTVCGYAGGSGLDILVFLDKEHHTFAYAPVVVQRAKSVFVGAPLLVTLLPSE